MAEKVSIIIEAVDRASDVFSNVGKGLLSIGGIAASTAVAGLTATGTALIGVGAAALGVEKSVDDAVDALIVRTGESGPALEAMRQSIINLGGSTAILGSDMETIGNVMGELYTRLGITGQGLEELTNNFMDLARLTGGDGVKQVQLVTRVMGDWGIENENAAKTLDMLFGASQAFGISVDDVAAKVVQFGAPMRQMGFDLEASVALFGKWEKEGVNAELAIGSLRIAAGNFARDNIPLQDGLRDTITAIKGATSESEALALAMDVFGARAGPDMAAAIREGRFELDEAIKILRATEGSLSQTVEATLDFRDRFTVSFNEAKLALLPLGEALTGLAEQYMPMVADFISNVFVPTVANLVTWVGENLPIAIAFVSNYWENVLKPAIEIAWSFLSQTVIPYIQNVVIPFLTTAVPTALQTLANFWTNVLQPAIATVWQWMSTVLIPFFANTVIPWLQEKTIAALQMLANFWMNVLKPAMEAVWRFLTQDMMPIWLAISDFLGVAFPLVLTALQGIWQNVLLPAMTSVWAFIKDKLGPVFEWLKTSVIDAVASSFEGLSGTIQRVADWINNLTEALRNIKLPDWMTPGSPTPWEIGLRGVASELQSLSRTQLPAFSAALNYAPSPAFANLSSGAGRNNVNFAAGSIVINAVPGMNEQLIADRVIEAVNRKLGAVASGRMR